MIERRHCRGNIGFTLIELLVVIGIIAVLSAILFPVFAQVREKARSIACLSNERQIAMGAMQYLQDYDGCFPMDQYYSPNTYSGAHIQWPDMLNSYIKNGHTGDWNTGSDGVYHCPSFPSNQNFEIKPSYDVTPDGAVPWGGNAPAYPVANEQGIEAPSDKIYMLECGQNNEWGGWATFSDWEWDWTDGEGPDSNGNPTRAGAHLELRQDLHHDCDFSITGPGTWSTWAQCGMMPRFRHNRACNVIFFDGHCKAMPAGKIDWLKNIYLPFGNAANWKSQGWYPY